MILLLALSLWLISGDITGIGVDYRVVSIRDFNLDSIDDFLIVTPDRTYGIYGKERWSSDLSIDKADILIEFASATYDTHTDINSQNHLLLGQSDRRAVYTIRSTSNTGALLYFSPDTFCTVPNCKECVNSGVTICDTCKIGYELKENTCRACPTGCSSCSQDVCVDCIKGYRLEGSLCVSCTSDCSRCAAEEGCQKCFPGYALDKGLCVACPDGCLDCSSPTICLTCASGYSLNRFQLCNRCSDGCISCPDAPTLCNQCDEGFFPNDPRCQRCSLGCVVCRSADSCDLCANGYWNSGGVCFPCITDNCMDCSNNFCSTCINGYQAVNGECIACPRGCASCAKDISVCDACFPGFTFDPVAQQCRVDTAIDYSVVNHDDQFFGYEVSEGSSALVPPQFFVLGSRDPPACIRYFSSPPGPKLSVSLCNNAEPFGNDIYVSQIDLNRDLVPDIVVTTKNDDGFFLIFGYPTPTGVQTVDILEGSFMRIQLDLKPLSFASSDLNKDGFLDLIVCTGERAYVLYSSDTWREYGRVRSFDIVEAIDISLRSTIYEARHVSGGYDFNGDSSPDVVFTFPNRVVVLTTVRLEAGVEYDATQLSEFADQVVMRSVDVVTSTLVRDINNDKFDDILLKLPDMSLVIFFGHERRYALDYGELKGTCAFLTNPGEIYTQSQCRVGEYINKQFCVGNVFNYLEPCARCPSCPIGTYQALPCDGFATYPNNLCLPCAVDKCSTCDATKCLSCLQGYYSFGDACLPCSATNCVSCASNVCTQCKPGFLLDSGACKSVCPSGTYYATDGKCAACSPNCRRCTSYQTCDSCVAGYFSSYGFCTACQASLCGPMQYFDSKQCTTTTSGCVDCTVCAAGSYAISPCLSTSNTGCAVCFPATCAAGQYESVPCTATTNRWCQACSNCTLGQTYQAAPCTSTSDRFCPACTTCVSGTTYETSPCTLTTNRVCTGCSVCSTGFYQTQACTLTQNRVCSACTNCTLGRFQSSPCTSIADRVCTACAPNCLNCTSSTVCTSCNSGFFLSNGSCLACGLSNCLANQYYNNSGCNSANNGCLPCSSCVSGVTYRATACTVTTNTVCQTCRSCLPGSQYETGACTLTTDRVCSACRAPCSGGFYESTTCTPTTDRVCSACSTTSCSSCPNNVCSVCNSGFYLDSNICRSCSSIVCPVGRYQVLANCSSSSTGCIACSTSNCATCPNNICSSCVANFWFNGSTCVACNANIACGNGLTYSASACGGTVNGCITQGSCPTGCNQCTSTTVCALCNANFYLLANFTCRSCGSSNCAVGTYYNQSACSASNSGCQACDATCRSCTNATSCTDCISGHYLSNGRCLACQTCRTGQFLSAACTANSNTVCQSCMSNCDSCSSTSVCSACSPNFFYINNTCTACRTCGAGSYFTTNCSHTTNSACAICSACPTGRFVSTPCSSFANAQCAACISNCGVCSNSTFAGCQSCLPGFFLNTTSQTCQACTTCPINNYPSTPCSGSTNTRCSACSTCPSGRFVSSACGTTNTVCADCVSNCSICSSNSFATCTACQVGYFRSSLSSACLACSACGIGQFERVPCANTTNTNCQNCIQDCRSCVNGTFQGCSQCNSGFFLDLTNLICRGCGTCGSGTYVSSACTARANVVCSACISNCDVCNGPTFAACSRCLPGFYLDTITQQCRACSVCPAATYTDVACGLNTNTTCAACINNCQTCTNPTYQGCQRCSNGFYLLNSTLSCKDCSVCAVGSYVASPCTGFTDTACSGCITNCLNCVNGTFEGCTSCRTGYYRNVTTRSCQLCQDCSSGKFTSAPCTVNANRICTDCSTNCLTCVNATFQGCSLCNTNFYLNSATQRCEACNVCGIGSITQQSCTTRSNTVCTAVPCPSFSTPTGSTCTCNSGYNGGVLSWTGTSWSGICVQSSGCSLVSTGLSTNSTCTSVSSSQSCVVSCQSGYFISGPAAISCSNGVFTPQTTCTACLPNCFQCSNAVSCSLCQPGYYFNTSACVACTPIVGCSNLACNNNITSTCSQCLPGYYLSGGVCLVCTGGVSYQCGQGYYRSGSACINGLTNTQSCTVCQGGVDYDCVNGYPIGTRCSGDTDIDTQRCGACAPNCAICSDSSFASCIACQTGYYLDFILQRCVACNQVQCGSGFYLDSASCDSSNNGCKACAPLCKTCSSGDFSSCTECITTDYRLDQTLQACIPYTCGALENGGDCNTLVVPQTCSCALGYNSGLSQVWCNQGVWSTSCQSNCGNRLPNPSTRPDLASGGLFSCVCPTAYPSCLLGGGCDLQSNLPRLDIRVTGPQTVIPSQLQSTSQVLQLQAVVSSLRLCNGTLVTSAGITGGIAYTFSWTILSGAIPGVALNQATLSIGAAQLTPGTILSVKVDVTAIITNPRLSDNIPLLPDINSTRLGGSPAQWLHTDQALTTADPLYQVVSTTRGKAFGTSNATATRYSFFYGPWTITPETRQEYEYSGVITVTRPVNGWTVGVFLEASSNNVNNVQLRFTAPNLWQLVVGGVIRNINVVIPNRPEVSYQFRLRVSAREVITPQSNNFNFNIAAKVWVVGNTEPIADQASFVLGRDEISSPAYVGVFSTTSSTSGIAWSDLTIITRITTNSATYNIEIQRSNIVANIAGGTSLTTSRKNDLVLRGTGSGDPNILNPALVAQYVTYSWLCYDLTMLVDCTTSLGVINEIDLTIPAFLLETHVYNISLVVKSNYLAVAMPYMAVASMEVRFFEDFAPKVTIDTPSGILPIREVSFRLYANVIPGITPLDQLLFQWTELSQNLPLNDQTLSSPPDSRSLVINPNVLQYGYTYTFQITVIDPLSTSSSSSASIVLLPVNIPPQNGQCYTWYIDSDTELPVFDLVNITQLTEVHIGCSGWTDIDGNNEKIRFSFDGKLNQSIDILLSASSSNSEVVVYLPIGEVVIEGRVIDEYGSWTPTGTVGMARVVPSAVAEPLCAAIVLIQGQLQVFSALGLSAQALILIRQTLGLLVGIDLRTSGNIPIGLFCPSLSTNNPTQTVNQVIEDQFSIIIDILNDISTMSGINQDPRLGEEVANVLVLLVDYSTKAQSIVIQEEILQLIVVLINAVGDNEQVATSTVQVLSLLLNTVPCNQSKIVLNALQLLSVRVVQGVLPNELAKQFLADNLGAGSTSVYTNQSTQLDILGIKMNLTAEMLVETTTNSSQLKVVVGLYNQGLKRCRGNGIASDILSIDIKDLFGNNQEVAGLGTPFTFLIPYTANNSNEQSSACAGGQSIQSAPVCSWWDDIEEQWRSDGCATGQLVFVAGKRYVQCSCTHLTEFALILYEQSHPCAQLDRNGFQALIVAYTVMGAFTLIQVIRILTAPERRSWKDELLIEHVLGTLCCLCRLLEMAHFGGLTTFTSGWIGLFSSIPYMLVFWIFMILVFQWANIYHLSMSELSSGKGKVKYLFMACAFVISAVIVLLFLSLSTSAFGAKGNKSVALLASITACIIYILTGTAFLLYGSAVSRQLNRGMQMTSVGSMTRMVNESGCECCRNIYQLWKNSLPFRMTLAAVIVSGSFLAESVLWVLSIQYIHISDKLTFVFLGFELLALLSIFILFARAVTARYGGKKKHQEKTEDDQSRRDTYEEEENPSRTISRGGSVRNVVSSAPSAAPQPQVEMQTYA